MRDAFGELLVELARPRPELIVLDGDVQTSTRTDRFRAAFPSRFVQCGIAEQNMVGVAAGLAMMGFTPLVVTFGAFCSKRACEQIAVSAAYARAGVKLVGAYAGVSAGKAGATHHATDDVAVLRAVPGITILDPCDAPDLRSALEHALDTDGPAYVRVVREGESPLPTTERSPARPIVLQIGRDVLLLSTGIMAGPALAAAALLETRHVTATVAERPDPE